MGDLADAVGDGLALLGGHEPAQFVGAVEQALPGGAEDVRTLGGGLLAPGFLRLAGSGDDPGDLAGGRDGDLAHGFACGGVV